MTPSEAGKLGALKCKENFKIRKQKEIENYYINHKICPICGKPISYEKRFNKCCCQSCSVILGNTGRKHSEKTKQKIANTLRKNLVTNINKTHICKEIEKDKFIKTKKCTICGLPKDNEHDHTYCRCQLIKSLIKFGLNISFLGTPEILNEFKRVKHLIEEHYIKYSSNEDMLKEKLNYYSGSANFHKLLKSLGIKTRSSSEAVAYSYYKKELPRIANVYRHGKYITWENKEIYYRSSYELDYAIELDNYRIKYDYEKLRIKYYDTQLEKYRCSVPDFYLIDTNTIVEIKSNYTLDIQNMKDRIKAYKEAGYNFKLILEHKEIDINSL